MSYCTNFRVCGQKNSVRSTSLAFTGKFEIRFVHNYVQEDVQLTSFVSLYWPCERKNICYKKKKSLNYQMGSWIYARNYFNNPPTRSVEIVFYNISESLCKFKKRKFKVNFLTYYSRYMREKKHARASYNYLHLVVSSLSRGLTSPGGVWIEVCRQALQNLTPFKTNIIHFTTLFKKRD